MVLVNTRIPGVIMYHSLLMLGAIIGNAMLILWFSVGNGAGDSKDWLSFIS